MDITSDWACLYYTELMNWYVMDLMSSKWDYVMELWSLMNIDVPARHGIMLLIAVVEDYVARLIFGNPNNMLD